MAKVTVAWCDVKPCTCQAEREFEVNGQKLYVCGEQCFARFWSREYGDWKESLYATQITFHRLTAVQKYDTQKVLERKNGTQTFSSNLQSCRAVVVTRRPSE